MDTRVEVRRARVAARRLGGSLAGVALLCALTPAAAGAAETHWLSAPYQAGLANPGSVYDPETLTVAQTGAEVPLLSADGTRAVFGIAQAAPYFVGPPAGRGTQTLRYDLRTGAREVLGRADGAAGALDPDWPASASINAAPRPAISADADTVWTGFAFSGAAVELADRLRVGDRNERVQLDNSEPPLAFGTFQGISGDGRYVLLQGRYTSANGPFPQVDGFAWTGTASAVVRQRYSLFLRDRETGRTRALVVGHDGALPDQALSSPSISDDGRSVVFASSATNILPGYGTSAARLYRIDLRADGGPRTEVVAVGQPATATPGASTPALSGNGRYLAFASQANLTGVATGGKTQVYRHDLQTGETILVTRRGTDGPAGDDSSSQPRISADGRWIVYRTTARNLVTLEHPQLNTALLWDAATASTGKVVLTPTGDDPANDFASGSTAGPRSDPGDVSDDGRYVAFSSDAPGLVPATASVQPAQMHAYVRDRATPPAVQAAPAAETAATRATVAGTVSVPGPDATSFQETAVRVQYGPTVAYGSTTTIAGTLGGGTGATVQATLTGLAPATTYHYRLVAANAAGEAHSEDGTFTTAAEDGVSRQLAVSGTVGGVLGLELSSASASLGTFLPGVAADHDATLTGTLTSTGPAALTVTDEGPEPGHLLNDGAPLDTALRVCAATPTCAYAPLGGGPLTLASFTRSVSAAPITIGLRQSITASEPLVPGTYGKTLTFTATAGTP